MLIPVGMSILMQDCPYCTEQKKLIEKAEEEERLIKEKEEKRIKEEAEKKAAEEKKASDASQEADSEDANGNEQEGESKVGILFCICVDLMTSDHLLLVNSNLSLMKSLSSSIISGIDLT
jgi:glutaredoxin